MEANYKEMYFELFNSISGIIEQLQELQKKAEESYISANDGDGER